MSFADQFAEPNLAGEPETADSVATRDPADRFNEWQRRFSVSSTIPEIEYGQTTIGQLRVEPGEEAEGRQSKVRRVLIGDEPLYATDRFWTSLFLRYGFSKNFFNYFSHAEVFARIADRNANDRMRFCIERNPQTGRGRLLAVTNPTKAVVQNDSLLRLLERYEGRQLSYYNGVIESHHTPRTGGGRFEIAGDSFGQRFVVRTPVDGYGPPSIYLSLLREVCSNGMIGEHRAFRSVIAVGKGQDNVTYSLERALDGFHNDEGYAALRQRFEAAASSWASVHETNALYNLIAKLSGGGKLGGDGASALDALAMQSRSDEPAEASPPAGVSLLQGGETFSTHLFKRFHSLTGDVTKLYGLANLDTLSPKRQRTLPVDCKVYDLINFATEIATHHASTEAARRLQAWVGGLVSREFDLEGTADQFGDFRDFFLTDDKPGSDDAKNLPR